MAEKHSEKPPPKVHLFNATLRGMEEADQFNTPEDRQRAFEEVASEIKPWELVLGIVACAGAAFFFFTAVRLCFQHLLPRSIPAWVAEFSCYAGAAAGVFLTMRLLHRWGAAKTLRKKLRQSGVLVCLQCGYRLEGLRPGIENYPECGAQIDSQTAA